jgi:hypothetical protein
VNKFHIPNDFISADGENELHEKVDKDSKFRRYFNEFNQLISKAISDDVLRTKIYDIFAPVYVFAEIAAYKEGFKEGARFLMNAILSTDESSKSIKREKDFNEAFEKFLAEYRLDRIADVHDFLEKDDKYKKLIQNKEKCEKILTAFISGDKTLDALLNYMNAIDHLFDEITSIFYEHGFQDCAIISKAMKKGLNNMYLHNLLQ